MPTWDSPPRLAVDNSEPLHALYYPLSLNDSLQNMKFVSCGGGNGVELFAFPELYNVYNGWVWICIAASIVVGYASLKLSLND